MKFLILFALVGSVHAAQLDINAFDQEKLAGFLLKLPSGLVLRNTTVSDDISTVSQKFSPSSGAFEINCTSEYYEDSPIPSNPVCVVEIDEHHAAVEKKYDEWRISEKDLASVLFNTISPRGEVRIFRSGYFDEGTDFTGRNTYIFHYLFRCTEGECSYRFSEKKIN